MKKFLFSIIIGCSCMLSSVFSASVFASGGENDPFMSDNSSDTNSVEQGIADPLEAYNRAVYTFNDKLYVFFFRPVARGYGYVMPEPARKAVKRCFANAAMPVRFVNCLLQRKAQGAGIELSRFLVNTTIGIAGLFDPAKSTFGLKPFPEDSGQTLGVYGMSPGWYIVWPLLGPSTMRDTLGSVMDTLLDPLTYADIKMWERGALKTFSTVNGISMRIDVIDGLKKSAVDPYISLRNGYCQYRENAIKK